MNVVTVSGIDVVIEKKDIKHLYLYAKPPAGRMTVSAPAAMDDGNIRAFVASRIPWIRQQQKRFRDQQRQTERQYISGESLYLWGHRYNLDVVYSRQRNHIALKGKRVILQVREESVIAQRENVVNEWYRGQVEQAIPRLLEKWEGTMGVHADEWQVKNMRTKWGTCSVNAKRIWINLQLAKKPPECLEYVIVHELCHLREKSHNRVFVEYLDRRLPDWRNTKSMLNDFPMDSFVARN